MSELDEFDILSYDNNVKSNNFHKSTQVDQVSNNIYLILHDSKCYGYTNRKEKASKIIKKIADDKINFLKKTHPDLKIYYDFDSEKNMYSIYSVNSMIVVQYDHLESIIKFIQVKYIE